MIDAPCPGVRLPSTCHEESNRRLTGMDLATPNLDRLATIVDPMGELGDDERRQRAVQVLLRFERRIQPSHNGCRLWTGSVSADGYARFSINGRLCLARRFVYELWVGPIEACERVFSTCGVRACVSYSHLEARPVAMPTLPWDRFTRSWAHTEAGSWFLGLWTADGYLSRNASMSLAMKDHDGICLAARALGLPEERVGLHRALGRARIRVGVKWFLPRLTALGIAPGPKTGREHAPLGLELNRHFWRGIVDGDGWVSPARRVIGLVTASPTLLDQFVRFLEETIGCSPTLTERNKGTLYQATLSGSHAAMLASILYTESTFALPRKHAASMALIEGTRALHVLAEEQRERNRRIVAAYAAGQSAYEIAVHESVSADTVYYVLDRAGLARRPREWYAARRDHCRRGHPLNEANTRLERNGARRCRTCARERGRVWAQQRRRQGKEEV